MESFIKRISVCGFAAVLIILAIAAVSEAQTTTRTVTNTTRRALPITTRGRTTGSPLITTRRPAPCRVRSRCTARSPQVCGRNRSGMCRRFQNVCQLEAENCRIPAAANRWQRRTLGQCARLRVGATARCRRTTTRRPPIVTARPQPVCRVRSRCTARSPQVCGRNRSGMCRRFRNVCQLEEENCKIPAAANKWQRAPLRQCVRLRVGATARCRRTTTRRPPIVTARPRPVCRVRSRCTARSPQICGRNRSGMCRRFQNVCQLEAENCKIPAAANKWQRAPLTQCNLRVGVTAKCVRITTLPVITIRPQPVCRVRSRCTRRSPPMCGRNRNGMCHRFHNVCQLETTNCLITAPRDKWWRTPAVHCSHMRVGSTGRCRSVLRCPRRPVNCLRQRCIETCVISRNRQLCRVVANNCTLLNLNCFTTPRGNWSQTSMCNCKGMRVGDDAKACSRVAITGK